MKILIGTKNPGKIEGAKQAFEKYFDNVEIEGISVESEVGNQPFNEEILQGAKNRVKNLKKYAIKNNIQVDFYVASEAGITNSLGEWIDINAVIIEDMNGFQSFGTSQGFPIPDKYIDEIKETDKWKLAMNIAMDNGSAYYDDMYEAVDCYLHLGFTPEEICQQINFGSLNVDSGEIRKLFNI